MFPALLPSEFCPEPCIRIKGVHSSENPEEQKMSMKLPRASSLSILQAKEKKTICQVTNTVQRES